MALFTSLTLATCEIGYLFLYFTINLYVYISLFYFGILVIYVYKSCLYFDRIGRWIDEEEDKLRTSGDNNLQYIILDMSGN